MRNEFYLSLVLIWIFAAVSFTVLPATAQGLDGTVSPDNLISKIDAFKTALTSNGFKVTEWTYGKVDVAQLVCLGALNEGYGNNAGGSYIAITNYEQGVPIASEFQLNPDDAFVLIGRTPPPVAYFSYRSFLFNRQYEGQSNPTTLFASLGDTLNNLVIKTKGTATAQPNPYNQDVFIVSTPDRGVDAQVKSLAMSTGYSPGIMNTQVIPSSVAKLGKGNAFDSFVFLNRISLPAFGHEQDLSDYMQNPGMTVLYLSRSTPAPLDPFPTPLLRVRGTGLTEADLMPSLGNLRQAILDKNPGYVPTEYTTQIWLTEWLDGIQRKVNLIGESRDTTYLKTSAGFTLSDDEFLIIYGVNHQATGKATYSNFTIYQEAKDLGISAVNSPVFSGSAIDYIPGDTYAPYLYAWKAAFNCGDDPQCLKIEIPAYLQPCSNVDLTQNLFVGFRAYLEPATAVGPTSTELLYDQVIKFKNSSNTTLQSTN